MSLLTMIQDAADRIGISRPSAAIGSSDMQVRNLVALANQEGKELARRHTWQALITETTFTTVATETQSTVPTAFDRLIEGSMWNRTQNKPVIGPLTPQKWQQLKASLATGMWNSFRIRAGSILFTPTPTAGETIAYEYVSKYWAGISGSTSPTLAAWAADSDIAYLDEECMTLGLVWRFQRSRGLDYGEAFRIYETEVIKRMSEDGGMKILDLSSNNSADSLMDPYIADGSWSLS